MLPMLPTTLVVSVQSKSAMNVAPVMPEPIEFTVMLPIPAAEVNVESVIPAGRIVATTRPAFTVMVPIVEV